MVVQGPSSVSLPLQQKGSGSRRRSGELVEMHILRRLKHDSGRLASCVIAARDDESDYEVFIRGNAITTTQLCEPSSLPPNWGQVTSLTSFWLRALGLHVISTFTCSINPYL